MCNDEREKDDLLGECKLRQSVSITIAVPVGITHSLQLHTYFYTATPVKSELAVRGPKKGRHGLKKGSNPRFLGAPVNFL